MQLGADTKFSAQEAAEGMGEPRGGGVEYRTQIHGGHAGCARPGGGRAVSVARAAEVTTDTMGQFGLAAAEAGHIADVFAKGAAASSISVEQTWRIP